MVEVERCKVAKTRGTSTQVPWHSSDLCPVGKNFFESRRDRKPTMSEPETLDSGHACIPVQEPKVLDEN